MSTMYIMYNVYCVYNRHNQNDNEYLIEIIMIFV